MKKRAIISMVMSVVVPLIVSPFVSAGTVSGTVTYTGKVPKFREVKMDADPVCLSKHEDKVFPQTLVLGKNNGMANVFVYVKDGIFDEKFTAPMEFVVIKQEGCLYKPHVLGIMAGQPLKILNADGTLHNVHTLSKVNPEFNLTMPKFHRETTKVFDKPEFMFPMKCDVHPWMSAWISVMDHPFFAVTDKDGKFVIKGLPFGHFKIEAWHEKLGIKSGTVNMTNTGSSKINFSFSQ